MKHYKSSRSEEWVFNKLVELHEEYFLLFYPDEYSSKDEFIERVESQARWNEFCEDVQRCLI